MNTCSPPCQPWFPVRWACGYHWTGPGGDSWDRDISLGQGGSGPATLTGSSWAQSLWSPPFCDPYCPEGSHLSTMEPSKPGSTPCPCSLLSWGTWSGQANFMSSPPILCPIVCLRTCQPICPELSAVLSLSCLFVSCSVKHLLIQIFTVDKQIQKINRCVLQMYLAKITSPMVRSI